MYRRTHLKMLLFLNHKERAILLEKLHSVYDINTWKELYQDLMTALWNKSLKKAEKQGGK